jgi:hypothetical protein
VSGISWFDRQWGDLPEFFAGSPSGDGQALDSMNWLWSNVQLDNGTNIALGQVRDIQNHKLFLGLTAVDSEGTHLVVNAPSRSKPPSTGPARAPGVATPPAVCFAPLRSRPN